MSRFTYFAYCRKTNLVKIGRSANPRARVKQLRPVPVLFAIVPEELFSETQAHELFSSRRCMKEWFSVSKSEVVAALKLKEVPFVANDRIEGVHSKRVEGKPINGKRTVAFKIEEYAYERLAQLAGREGRSVGNQSLVLVLEGMGLFKADRRKLLPSSTTTPNQKETA